MFVAGVVVRTLPGAAPTVRAQLESLPQVEVHAETDDGFAVVLEAPTASAQEKLHERIAAWPDVAAVVLTFQSGQVLDEAESRDSAVSRESTESRDSAGVTG